MPRWDETEHPRWPRGSGDRSGEFRDAGGGWASTVASRFTGIPVYRRTATIDPELEKRFREQIFDMTRRSHEGKAIMEMTSEERFANSDLDWTARKTADELGGLAGKVDSHRLHLEAQQAYYKDWYRRRNHPDLTDEQMGELARESARKAFSGRTVAVRVTPAGLAAILEQGRFRTSFEPDIKSRGLKDVGTRALHEAALWGYGGETEPELRPIYGYLAGERRYAAKDSWDDALSQYGRIEVRLRDEVRARTTAMFGDSLDVRHAGRPSAVDDPDEWAWTYANPEGIVTNRLSGMPRDPDDPDFQGSTGYIEAQIHGGVGVADIAEVVLPSAPSAALKAALEKAGIPWRVVKA